MNQGLEREIGPYALSPLRVSVFKEAFSLSSNVAPFFCANIKGRRSRRDAKYLDVDLDFKIVTRAVRSVIASTAYCTIDLFSLELSEI